jgi:hypothetical protein
MPEHVIADSDLWLILDVLDGLPADEAQLRIREAIGRARQRFSLVGQRALDRIVRQLKTIS